MNRSKPFVALLLACALSTSHTLPLIAGSGTQKRIVRVGPEGTPAIGPTDFDKARAALTARRQVFDNLLSRARFAGPKGDLIRRQRARIEKMLLYVEIGRSTGAARSALIRQLPVTVTTSTVTGAQPGTYRMYSVGGEVRTSVFVPSGALSGVESTIAERPDGGGAAEPSARTCFYEDEDGQFEGECVDQQALDDAYAVEADLLANEAAMEAEAQEAFNVVWEYCQSNSCDQDFAPLSGPNVGELFGPLGCLATGVGAVGSASMAVYHRVKLSGLMSGGAIFNVAKGALAWKVTVAVGLVAAAVIFTGATVECYAELRYQ